MRSASRPAVSAVDESANGLGGSLRTRIRGQGARLRRRLLGSQLRTDAYSWHNTARGLRLFVGAAFAKLDAGGTRADAYDRVVSALFVFGALDAGAELGQLSRLARRRLELGFLRRAYELDAADCRRTRRVLRRQTQTPCGRHALHEGSSALLEWFHGDDPSLRLRALLERMPDDRLGVTRHRAPIPVRRPPVAREAQEAARLHR